MPRAPDAETVSPRDFYHLRSDFTHTLPFDDQCFPKEECDIDVHWRSFLSHSPNMGNIRGHSLNPPTIQNDSEGAARFSLFSTVTLDQASQMYEQLLRKSNGLECQLKKMKDQKKKIKNDLSFSVKAAMIKLKSDIQAFRAQAQLMFNEFQHFLDLLRSNLLKFAAEIDSGNHSMPIAQLPVWKCPTTRSSQLASATYLADTTKEHLDPQSPLEIYALPRESKEASTAPAFAKNKSEALSSDENSVEIGSKAGEYVQPVTSVGAQEIQNDGEDKINNFSSDQFLDRCEQVTTLNAQKKNLENKIYISDLSIGKGSSENGSSMNEKESERVHCLEVKLCQMKREIVELHQAREYEKQVWRKNVQQLKKVYETREKTMLEELFLLRRWYTAKHPNAYRFTEEKSYLSTGSSKNFASTTKVGKKQTEPQRISMSTPNSVGSSIDSNKITKKKCSSAEMISSLPVAESDEKIGASLSAQRSERSNSRHSPEMYHRQSVKVFHNFAAQLRKSARKRKSGSYKGESDEQQSGTKIGAEAPLGNSTGSKSLNSPVKTGLEAKRLDQVAQGLWAQKILANRK